MSRVIDTVFENGVFKPLEKIKFPEHKKLRIILEHEEKPIPMGKCTLTGIVDIAKECSDTDLSVRHDKYLYGEGID